MRETLKQLQTIVIRDAPIVLHFGDMRGKTVKVFYMSEMYANFKKKMFFGSEQYLIITVARHHGFTYQYFANSCWGGCESAS